LKAQLPSVESRDCSHVTRHGWVLNECTFVDVNYVDMSSRIHVYKWAAFRCSVYGGTFVGWRSHFAKRNK